MLLSFHTCFNFVNAILESMLGLKPSSDSTEPSYLKLVTVSSFCPFSLISLLMPLVLFVINLVFSALISIPYQFASLYTGQVVVWSNCLLDLGLDFLVDNAVFV